MKTKSTYDDPAVLKNLLAMLKAAEIEGYSVHISHWLDVPGKALIIRPDCDSFPHIDARSIRDGMKKSRKQVLQGNPKEAQSALQDEKVCLRIV